MPLLQQLVAAEKARLEEALRALKYNYDSLCDGPEFDDLSTTESSDPFGDYQIITTTVHSALRPFYAFDLMAGTRHEKHKARMRILSSLRCHSQLVIEAMLDAQGQLAPRHQPTQSPKAA